MPSFVRVCCVRQTFGRTAIIRTAKAAAAVATIKAAKMHNPDLAPSNTTHSLGASQLPPLQDVSVNFSHQQIVPPAEPQLKHLIAQKMARKEFFYGIELAAHNFGPQPTKLDYNSFGAVLPLFTSIVWLGQYYWNVSEVSEVSAMRLGLQLQSKTVTMPHFSCYRLSEKRLQEFLNLNFANVLAIRGDQVEPEQEYQHATDLIASIRALKGDAVSIGVAAYPDGHPDAKSVEDDMSYLLEKVQAGGDFIITQICFSSASLKSFIRKSRAMGINVPIIIGVFIPDNMRMLLRMMDIAKVSMDAEQLAEYKEHSSDPKGFQQHAVCKAVSMITDILDSDLGIYGVQFFTANKFRTAQLVLGELLARNSTSENKI